MHVRGSGDRIPGRFEICADWLEDLLWLPVANFVFVSWHCHHCSPHSILVGGESSQIGRHAPKHRRYSQTVFAPAERNTFPRVHLILHLTPATAGETSREAADSQAQNEPLG